MKKKILIASLLKPVDDVRSYWKLSKSMSKTNKYEINIIGKASKKLPLASDTLFTPIAIGRKQYLKRWFKAKAMAFQFLKVKADLIVVNTPELLPAAMLCKLLQGNKVVYDIQENQARNLIYLKGGLIGTLAAGYTRMIEHACARFVDHFWLAEKCYSNELPFLRSRFTVIENKAISCPVNTRILNKPKLLFSGTISEYAGIQRAIDWYQQIKKAEPSTTLKVIGQIHDSNLGKWLERMASSDKDLQLQVSADPIDYAEILHGIRDSNLGLIAYDLNPVNQNKIPTKLYEYSRYKLPYLVLEKSLWSKEGTKLGGAIPCNFQLVNVQKTLQDWRKQEQLFPTNYPKDKTWEEESKRLLLCIDTLLNTH